VIDSLCNEPSEEGIATAMFYCDFRDRQEQTTANIMGTILNQLAVRGGEVMEYMGREFQQAKKEVGGRGLRLPDMVEMLKQAVAALPRVFICIDALDECHPQHLLDLLVSLKGVLQDSPRTRIFLTGRPQVEAQVTRYFPDCAIVPVSPRVDDVKRYLENKLDRDPGPGEMSVRLRADILEIIPRRISEMYVRASTGPTSCIILLYTG